MKSVTIIGGGFCGTIAAINLARLSPRPLKVTIVNCQYPAGRGVAYGTRRPEHVLNVVARNMSAFPDRPAHFVEWLQTRSEYAAIPESVLREQFIPRSVYGDYLQGLLFSQRQELDDRGTVKIDLVEDEVVDVEPLDEGMNVLLKNGPPIPSDRVLLATGNLPPRDPIVSDVLSGASAYFRNPWGKWFEKLPDPKENILLIGTGLTMIDVFMTLRASGWAGIVYAVSRNGLLPLPHFRGSDYAPFPPEEPWKTGLQGLSDLIDEHCARLRADGRNPAVLVDKLRPYTQRIWRALSLDEKREFTDRYRARWNVVRHRIPPGVAGQIEAAQQDGTLLILQGRIASVERDGERLAVQIASQGEGPPRRLTPALMINCTGPRETFADASEPLFQNLFRRGLVCSDQLNMGIEVTPEFAVVGQNAQASESLFAIGPLLKGTLWETTAVPELRAQALHVAQVLVASEQQTPADWVQETPENFVEYYI